MRGNRLEAIRAAAENKPQPSEYVDTAVEDKPALVFWDFAP
jgi:hypothetical protein